MTSSTKTTIGAERGPGLELTSIASVPRSRELFQPGDVPDELYSSMRDKPHCVKWKSYCEELWARYAPYADQHFLDEIRVQFHPRFWEMYLTVTFLERGYQLHRHPRGGPEFGIDVEGKRYWFDAIAPTHGKGADAVPEMNVDGGGWVPQQQMILRYTHALATKRAKWVKDLQSGRVSKTDGFIVAINDRQIPWAWAGAEMPYIVKALYGIGDLAVAIDLQTHQIIETKHQARPTIAKVSGEHVSSRAFVANECPEVSAIIYSFVNAANYPPQLGENFMVLHNDEPNVPLPAGSFRFGREYRVVSDSLDVKDWSS